MNFFAGVLPLLVFVVVATGGRLSYASGFPGFKCTSNATSCRAMVGFVAANETTISAIQKLFSISDFNALLSANGLPSSTAASLPVKSSETIKIPFNCSCNSNQTGVSANMPVYIVKSGDTLDTIASKIFSGLVTYQQIATINNMTNPDKIDIGQKLRIPLPCSCDQVDGVPVVHYAHVVAPMSTVAGIAQQFGTTEGTLLSLNGIANASLLQANQVLDVPLRVCNSSVMTDSVDYPLLVPNGTYTYTANNCVRCSCDSGNNWTLQCEASRLQNVSCPAMQCSGTPALSLGNSTVAGCNSSTCTYLGFDGSGALMTATLSHSTCPASGTGDAITKSWAWGLAAAVMYSMHFL